MLGSAPSIDSWTFYHHSTTSILQAVCGKNAFSNSDNRRFRKRHLTNFPVNSALTVATLVKLFFYTSQLSASGGGGGWGGGGEGNHEHFHHPLWEIIKILYGGSGECYGVAQADKALCLRPCDVSVTVRAI